MSSTEHAPGPRVVRQDGVTAAERYLKKLCDKTFLSLWSYPGVYRDQGRTATSREGKEVCDLLVVFERHVIIFSDKDCHFPSSGKPALDWARWFRRAVLKSAEQVWGAERWIKKHPNRLFLDRSCTRRFPIDLPDPATAKFHRVVVAHDASRRCQDHFGGSGSLIILPAIVGPMHYEGEEVRPFHIGQVDPARGYVHVFDDTSLDVVMRTLDTITDFVNYLSKKEQLIESGRLMWAAGEDDLLGYYLLKVNDQGEHDIIIPEGGDAIVIPEGLWAEFESSVGRRAQVQADRVSYLWDRMIERFSRRLVAGTTQTNPGGTFSTQELILRYMAREPRFRRRMLATSVVGLIQKTPADRHLFRATRVVPPQRAGDPHYVFLLLRGPEGEPEERYHVVRRKTLQMACMVTKLRFPDAQFIVGYATEPGPVAGRTEDALWMDARDWTDELQAEAKEYQEKLGLLTKVQASYFSMNEYPVPPGKRKGGPPRSMRNSLCPCGSGKKYKQCCLRARRR
jgi:hypothetical protein